MKVEMRAAIFITAVSLAATLAPWARAGERVTLSNGSEMSCDHHAAVDGRVRLFLSAGEDNYIEFAPNDVVATEHVADPPAALPAATQLPAVAPEVALSPADLREMLVKAGGEHNLDVDLLASLVKAESGGNAHAVSRAGARGLMQLMPSTANQLGVQDSFRPDENVRGGSTYLDAMLTRYHDNLALALAAYNAGPLAVDRYHGIPPYQETRAYVARVIHEFNRRVRAREALAAQSIAAVANPKAKTIH
jgi:soluble lytic murein transglycosylase-like protein